MAWTGRGCWSTAGLGLALVLVGCGPSDEEVAVAMEQGLRDANLALVGALVADELLVHVHEPPDNQLRHGTSDCGCPCTSRTGAPPAAFQMSLDYHDTGCVPDSGLLPTMMSNVVEQACEGDAVSLTLAGATFGVDELALGGDLSGRVDPATSAVETAGDLVIGDHRFDDVVLSIANDHALGLDGTLGVDGGRVRFDGLGLPRDRIGAPCPTPLDGALVVEGDDEDTDVIVDFAHPGLGSVTVTRGKRVSEAVSWCAFRSDLL